MNVVLKRLRDAVSWFRDIDYDRNRDIDYDTSHNIDWLDDFDPNEPRKPKGGPGGGQWTAAGGAAAAASVPTPGTIQVGKQGSAKKLAQYVAAHLTSGTDPNEVAAKLKAYGANYNYSGYAGYANQLIKHVEAAHGLAPGTLGKAVSKKMAALTAEGGGPPAPTDEEIQSMAAVAAGEPAAEPATTEALPAVPDLPPPGSHDNVQKIAEIVGNKWTPEEKVAWIEALAGDIPPEDAAGQAYATGQIAKLKGGDVPVTSGNLPQVPVTSGAAPEPEPTPVSLPPMPAPVLKTQTKIADITYGSMPIADKIDAINAMLVNITHQPNIDYANQALAMLKAQAGLATPTAAAAPAEQPSGAVQAMVNDPSLSPAEKIKQLTEQMAMYAPATQAYAQEQLAKLQAAPAAAAPVDLSTLSPEAQGLASPNAQEFWTFVNQNLSNEDAANHIQMLLDIKVQNNATEPNSKVAQYAKKLIAALKGGATQTQAAPAAAAAPEAFPTKPDLTKLLTPQEQTALEKALPLPGGPQAEQDLWETAAMKGWTAAAKIKQLEADMTSGGIAEAGQTALSQQANAYAKSLISHLKFGPLPTAFAEPAHQAAPPDTVAPSTLPAIPSNLELNAEAQAAFDIAQFGTIGNPDKLAALQEFHKKATAGDFGPGFYDDKSEVGHYVNTLITALQSASPASDPTVVPDVPAHLQQYSEVKQLHELATGSYGYKAAQVEAFFENAKNNGFTFAPGSEATTYAESVIAAKKAQEAAQTPAAPASTIPPPTGQLTSVVYANAAYSMANSQLGTPTDKMLEVAKYLNEKVASGNIVPGSDSYDYIKSLIVALGGSPTWSASAAPPTPIPPMPSPDGGPSTIQGKIYKAANAYGTSLEQKIANIQAMSSSLWKNKNYKTQVLKVLKAKQAAAASSNPAVPAAPAPPKQPATPPPTVPDPAAGSNTQNSMWTVAIKPVTDPIPMNNTEKIAEITKLLANSGGSDGGKAETYANQLITALGGTATTASAAKAAQPKIAPTPYSGGGTMGTPSAPAGPKLSFSSEVDPANYPAWTKAMPKPTPDERTAVAKYTGHYYTQINDKMRSGIGLEGDYKEWAKNLHIFLDRAVFPDDAVLTRKVSGEYAKKLIASMKMGTLFVDHGFVSSDNWSGDLTVKIHVKKGAKAAFVDSISSNKGSEKEVIIQNGAHFRVTGYDAAQKHITCDLLDPSDPDYFL